MSHPIYIRVYPGELKIPVLRIIRRMIATTYAGGLKSTLCRRFFKGHVSCPKSGTSVKDGKWPEIVIDASASRLLVARNTFGSNYSGGWLSAFIIASGCVCLSVCLREITASSEHRLPTARRFATSRTDSPVHFQLILP